MKSSSSILALFLGWLASSVTLADSPIQPGDRIAIVGNTFADQLRIHGYLESRLLQRTRLNSVSIRNLGWGGDMLTSRDRPTNFPTEESALTAHQTDVIIACFGLGEAFGGKEALDRFKTDLDAFIASHTGKTYNGRSEVRLVLVSPIACEDLGSLTSARQLQNRDLESYTRAMSEVAAAANIPFVNLFEPSRYLMDEPTGPQLTNNGIHLNAYGYWAMSRTFCDHLLADDHEAGHHSWRLRIDAAAKVATVRGVRIFELIADESGLSFEVQEESVPTMPPPTDQQLPPQLDVDRDTLVVDNLTPGIYQLTIDGKPVAKADARDWAEGVAVDSSPAHLAAEAYRAAVNDKNLQFTYSWKALNQVHIVGERRASPSGRELPLEVIEFNKLAYERDEALRSGLDLNTRQWRLTRLGM